jgi:hypothetical protein
MPNDYQTTKTTLYMVVLYEVAISQARCGPDFLVGLVLAISLVE